MLYTEFDKVLSMMDDIITALKETPGATDMLTGKYKREGCMAFTENPTTGYSRLAENQTGSQPV